MLDGADSDAIAVHDLGIEHGVGDIIAQRRDVVINAGDINAAENDPRINRGGVNGDIDKSRRMQPIPLREMLEASVCCWIGSVVMELDGLNLSWRFVKQDRKFVHLPLKNNCFRSGSQITNSNRM